MKTVNTWALSLGLGLGLAAAAAHAQMVGGLPIGEVAPDETVTPSGGAPSLLSDIQRGRLMVLVAFKTT